MSLLGESHLKILLFCFFIVRIGFIFSGFACLNYIYRYPYFCVNSLFLVTLSKFIVHNKFHKIATRYLKPRGNLHFLIDKMESKKIVNLIFLLIFLTEIILGIIYGLYFQIDEYYLLCYWASLLMIIITGFYAIIVKELPYLLAFCIINVAPSLIFIDLLNHYDDYYYEFHINDLELFKKQKKVIDIVSGLAIFFDILFIILFIIIMKKKYWSTDKDHTIATDKKPYLRQIFFPNDISPEDLKSLRKILLTDNISSKDLKRLRQIFLLKKRDLKGLQQILLPKNISPEDLESLRQIFLPNDISQKDLENLQQMFWSKEKDLESLHLFNDISPKDLESLRQIILPNDISPKDLESLRQIFLPNDIFLKDLESLRQIFLPNDIFLKDLESLRQIFLPNDISPKKLGSLRQIFDNSKKDLKSLQLNDISPKDLESLQQIFLPNDISSDNLENLRKIILPNNISPKVLENLQQIFDISKKDLEESYIMYKFYNFLLYTTLPYVIIIDFRFNTQLIRILFNTESNVFFVFFVVLTFMSFFILIFGLKIIKEESTVFTILIYLALMGQCFICIIYSIAYNTDLLIPIATSILLFLLFINTIKCHRNFGKKLKLYLKFNPILDEAYNYYSDNNKNEKSPKKLKEKIKAYWNSFKSFFSDFVIGEKKMIK